MTAPRATGMPLWPIAIRRQRKTPGPMWMRQDLNLRPPPRRRGTLAGLSYASGRRRGETRTLNRTRVKGLHCQLCFTSRWIPLPRNRIRVATPRLELGTSSLSGRRSDQAELCGCGSGGGRTLNRSPGSRFQIGFLTIRIASSCRSRHDRAGGGRRRSRPPMAFAIVSLSKRTPVPPGSPTLIEGSWHGAGRYPNLPWPRGRLASPCIQRRRATSACRPGPLAVSGTVEVQPREGSNYFPSSAGAPVRFTHLAGDVPDAQRSLDAPGSRRTLAAVRFTPPSPSGRAVELSGIAAEGGSIELQTVSGPLWLATSDGPPSPHHLPSFS